MKPVVAFPYNDPDGMMLPHLTAILMDLKNHFDHAYVSSPPSTLELLQQNDLLLTDDFFTIYPVDENKLIGEHFAYLYQRAAEDAHPEIDRIVAQLLLLGGLVHHPVHHRQVDRAYPHAHLAGDALVEFVVDPSAVALRGDQLLVGILHRDRPTAQMVERDSQTLGHVIGGTHRVAGVVADFLEEPEHGTGSVERRGGWGRGKQMGFRLTV